MNPYPDAHFLKSAYAPADFPSDRGAEVAVAGRSNAGKSSAINTVLGRRGLARTSKTPGRTQLLNFFELQANVRLVDLPGYGFAKAPSAVREQWRELVTAYFAQRACLRGLLVVVDIRRGITPSDRQLLDWALPQGVRGHVLLTKTDKLSRQAAAAELARVREALCEAYPEAIAVQLFSAMDRTGVDEARAALVALLAPI